MGLFCLVVRNAVFAEYFNYWLLIHCGIFLGGFVMLFQAVPEIQIDMGKVEHRIVFSDKGPGASSGESRATSGAETGSIGGSGSLPEVSHLGWGRWYTLRELEAATDGLSDENVIGEGGYGIVYRGVLADGTRVAVKNLLNNRYLSSEFT